MNLLEQYKAFLKAQGLEDDVIEKIVKAMPGANIFLASEEKLDDRYTKLKGQKELLEEQLKGANATIETLKKSNSSNEDLQNEVQKYKDANKDLQDKYDKDVVGVEKKQQLLDVLSKEGALHPALLVSTFDLDKVEYKDGKISGYEDSLKALKESYADQFKAKDPEGGTGKDGKDGKDGKGTYTYTPAGGKDPGGKATEDIFAAMQAHSVRD